MKRPFLWMLLLLARLAVGQNIPARVDQDTLFRTVLARQLVYPLRAETGAYARIYAGFSIDKKGHVQRISILNPGKIEYGFEEEVTRSLNRLPTLNPQYEGDYVLPINFVFINYEDHNKETIADGTVPSWYFGNRTVLSEIRRENAKPFRQRSTKYIRYRNPNLPNGYNP